MKGYKAFNNDLTCLGYQFSIDEPNIFDYTPILCEQGFHFCTTLEDVVKYYHNPNMRVFEIEASGIITDAKDGCSKRACNEIRLVKEISLDEVMLSITKSEPAYYWARAIGNQDIMINKITESEWAFRWALNIGNLDIMINHIKDSEWAFWWANNIGNCDIMINYITESEWAFWWAMGIGNQDVMINHITGSEWIENWNNFFPSNRII